jgi:acetyl-CoA carboxylase carboxyl transferase subunit alpha
MDQKFLDFEQPIAELEAKIDELRFVGNDSEVNINDEIERLKAKSKSLTRNIFADLNSWQIAQLARHPLRPYALDYLQIISPDFQELMQMAEKFRLPVITLIDTPGAYPGVGAEERGQSEAIARNLFVMARLNTPIVCAVIGEGGSGGALAIGVGDRLVMLEYSVYSVISPEGCASILWKSAEHAEEAAEAMGITAGRLAELRLVDEVLREPLGGAHRDLEGMAQALQNALVTHLRELEVLDTPELLRRRQERLAGFGRFREN